MKHMSRAELRRKLHEEHSGRPLDKTEEVKKMVPRSEKTTVVDYRIRQVNVRRVRPMAAVLPSPK